LRIFSYILVLIILISSCKKQELKEDISGLSGKWKASATCFYFGSGDYESIYLSDTIVFHTSEVFLEMKDDGELIFSGAAGAEKWTVVSYRIKEKVYEVYKKQYPTAHVDTKYKMLELTLRNEKHQKFYFNYSFNDATDSVIYGDFWRKNQGYHSTRTPNFYWGFNPFWGQQDDDNLYPFVQEAKFVKLS
jgi:hypothetical protein